MISCLVLWTLARGLFLARPDDDLWSIRNHLRADVIRMTRTRLRQQLAQRGVIGVALNVADIVLDPAP